MSGERNDKDYYVILGVRPAASRADITAAYYLLARQCHPDARQADPAALSKFKLINEAYEVLSDEHKRRDYDRRHRQRRWPTPASPSTGYGFAPHASQATSFHRPTPPAPKVAARADDIGVILPIMPEEARHGGFCEFTLTVHSDCDHCDGRGQIADKWCSSCQGTGQTRERRRLRINLPRGLRTGSVIRVAGQGKRSASTAGDLLVRIKVQPYL